MTAAHVKWRLAVAGFCLCQAASAQTAASLTGVSDFRLRGVSLSGNKPALQLNLSLDQASGWFLGASGAGWHLDTSHPAAALFAHAGYARWAADGGSWEVGISGAHFSDEPGYDYAELFAGLAAPRWNARVHVSPSYFGSGKPTVYAEFNGGQSITPTLAWFGHLGALASLQGGMPGDRGRRARLDVQLGLSASLGDWEWRLSGVGVGRGGPFAPAYGATNRAWVLSASYFF